MSKFDVVVIGLGYVGLPVAQGAASVGASVAGLDANPAVVDGLQRGHSHVDDLSDADISQMLDRGFTVTADPAIISDCDVCVICVPTPLSDDGGPDLTAVRAAVTAVGRNLRADQLVILESTTYPGTTEEVVAPLLEELSGLTAGQDFALAFSPERIDPGNATWDVRNTPKVVGGLTPGCTDRAAQFYGRFIERVVPAKGTREAEMSKLLENTYRHINIALVNEMARFCYELDIDLWDVVHLASTKPFGFQPFYPGPGVGGHCIPIDPNYLSHRIRSRLGYPFRFVELAQEINATMPAYVAGRAQRILNDAKLPTNGASILLLGVTYKPDIADQRESPAVPLARHLAALGAVLSYHDPQVKDWKFPAARVEDADLHRAVADADLVLLVQAHSFYDVPALVANAQRLFDTRGVTHGDDAFRL